MEPQPLTMSSNYLAVVRGLRELHQLTEAGRLDSPEADAVRDATDEPWETLTDLEKKRIAGLSEDLYSLTESPRTSIKALNPQAQARLDDIDQARQAGDWDRAFELLRRWGDYLDPSRLSYLRGATWLGAGDQATAAIFLKHASDLHPADRLYLSIYLNVLNGVSPIDAHRLASEILQAPDDYQPIVIMNAAHIVINPTKELSEAEAVQFYREIIPILESTLYKIERGDDGGVDRISFAMACTLLGFCHEYLRESQAALRYYSKGLAANPLDVALLVARGNLLYGSSPGAIEDFQLAIRHKSPVIWPFYYLAHHNIVTGQFEECRRLCYRALEMNGSDTIKSELAEWLAISEAELGFPPDIVRGSFERSLRFDPSNERARRNLAIFEAATRPIPVNLYETRTSAAVRASGLSERRLARAA